MNFNKWWLIPTVIILLLAILNPTFTDFKEFTSIKYHQYELRKRSNFVIFSIYEDNSQNPHLVYLGIAKNFFIITNKSNKEVQKNNTTVGGTDLGTVDSVIDSSKAAQDSLKAK